MNMMQMAMAKAGLTSEEEILKKEAADAERGRKLQEDLDAEKAEEAAERAKEEEKIRESLVPFDKIWEGEKSKPFMWHLLKSFLPANKVTQVGEWNKAEPCCICGKTCISVKALVAKDPDLVNRLGQLQKRIASGVDVPAEEAYGVYNGHKQAVTSPDSKVIMCVQCNGLFNTWFEYKTLKGELPKSLLKDLKKEYATKRKK